MSDTEATMGQTRTRVYRAGVLEAEGFPVASVSDYLERPDTTVWVDLQGPSEEDLLELADELGLHELAVEDALGPHQRPKLDYYPTHRFLSCHAVRINADASGMDKSEIDAFIHQRWLITVHKAGGFFDVEAVLRRWDRSPDLATNGVGFLLYGLLDVIVDGYFDAVQTFEDFYDDISESIFEDRPLDPTQQQQWFHMRRALAHFHRLVAPMREAVSALMRREQATVSEELYPYYQDVYDHILRIGEATDSLRDLVSTIVETNLSLRDFHQNEIVKKVSGWAAIIAVPALITGYYGMNVPYPGSQQTTGFLTSLAILIISSVGLYALFRQRNWL